MNRTQLAARLYDIRDAAHTILGAHYTERMRGLGDVIKMNADRSNKDVLQAAMDICTTKNLQGLDLLFVMAATVELIEPSALVAAQLSG